MSSHRVLITGAATGMGALASTSLARRGHTVFATMRDPQGRNAPAAEALRASAADAAGSITVIELDVLSQESADRAVAEAVEASGGVDVLIHNAAHLLFGVTEAFSAEEVIRAFDVNAVGALRVNRAVLPHMRRAGSGLLLWNGSGTTRAIPPFLGPYTAAKAAFDAFAESTAWDVAVYGIETTILMPGVFTHGTAHFAKAAVPADLARTDEYELIAPFLASSAEDTERLMVNGVSADPQIVADEMVRIIELPRGRRPRRAIADGSDYGAEILNGAAEELRMRLARRMGLTALTELGGPHGDSPPADGAQDQAGRISAESLPAGAQRFIDATNAEDRAGLRAAFSENGTVDDFGRRFTGHAQIGGWSDRENIGTHNRITVQRVTHSADATLADITVTGNGYNGGGTFAFTFTPDGLIDNLTIRG